MSSRLDAFAPFSARIRSLVHVVTNSYNRSLFFAPKLREPQYVSHGSGAELSHGHHVSPLARVEAHRDRVLDDRGGPAYARGPARRLTPQRKGLSLV